MESLWDFSLTCYQGDALREQLESLQDSEGADVCILLSLAWMARCGYELSLQDTYKLLIDTREWRANVIGPLRDTRRAIKRAATDQEHNDVASSNSQPDGNPADNSYSSKRLYEAAKALELNAERSMLNEIAGCFMQRCIGDTVDCQIKRQDENIEGLDKRLASNISCYLREVLTVDEQHVNYMVEVFRSGMP